jgi:pSer/pThr/pTyr-binding forkhead associated (FHA) protein
MSDRLGRLEARITRIEGRLGIEDTVITSDNKPAKNDILIGRKDAYKDVHPDIDLSQIDVKTTVSRVHAVRRREADGFYVEDMGSVNGTFINGEYLKPGKPALLKPGDKLKIGTIEFHFDGHKLKHLPRWHSCAKK